MFIDICLWIVNKIKPEKGVKRNGEVGYKSLQCSYFHWFFFRQKDVHSSYSKIESSNTFSDQGFFKETGLFLKKPGLLVD